LSARGKLEMVEGFWLSDEAGISKTPRSVGAPLGGKVEHLGRITLV